MASSSSSPPVLLENPRETLRDIGPCWLLSHDELSLSRLFVAPDGRAALAFFQAVSELAAQEDHPLPDLHLTQGCHVEVVLTAVEGLSTHDIHLARAIDALPIAMAPAWRSAQTIDASDAAVSFDTAHYTTGPNGFFLQDDAIEAFEGIFENTEMRDIAASKEEIVKALRIAPGAVVADIGAGTGLLEPLLSAAVGTDGKSCAPKSRPNFASAFASAAKIWTMYLCWRGPPIGTPSCLPTGRWTWSCSWMSTITWNFPKLSYAIFVPPYNDTEHSW
jgi:pterin-4a-carbinolamine dehydratase